MRTRVYIDIVARFSSDPLDGNSRLGFFVPTGRAESALLNSVFYFYLFFCFFAHCCKLLLWSFRFLHNATLIANAVSEQIGGAAAYWYTRLFYTNGNWFVLCDVSREPHEMRLYYIILYIPLLYVQRASTVVCRQSCFELAVIHPSVIITADRTYMRALLCI